jgi:hypothetical protein
MEAEFEQLINRLEKQAEKVRSMLDLARRADLRKKEFRRQRGHGLMGQFVPVAELVARQDDLNLESWSQTILNNVQEKQWKK